MVVVASRLDFAKAQSSSAGFMQGNTPNQVCIICNEGKWQGYTFVDGEWVLVDSEDVETFMKAFGSVNNERVALLNTITDWKAVFATEFWMFELGQWSPYGNGLSWALEWCKESGDMLPEVVSEVCERFAFSVGKNPDWLFSQG